MNRLTRTFAGLALFGALFAAPASGQMMVEDDIVEVAVNAGQFTTLAAALDAAGLVETLKEGGPFTVFAPTDAAFAKLPEGTVEALLADVDALRAILTYHVVSGELRAGEVVAETELETVNGATIQISTEGGAVKVNDANVVATDVIAENGVIHVIDSVILPPQS